LHFNIFFCFFVFGLTEVSYPCFLYQLKKIREKVNKGRRGVLKVQKLWRGIRFRIPLEGGIVELCCCGNKTTMRHDKLKVVVGRPVYLVGPYYADP